MKITSLPLSDAMIGLVARRFRTLGEPYRLRILQLLESGERSVGELVDALGGNQSNVSRHLQVLQETGLVSRRRQGNSVYYSIADPMIFRLCELVCRSAARDARAQLAALARPVANFKGARR
jgi:DNA-binding transcriptional ArsR family regulator